MVHGCPVQCVPLIGVQFHHCYQLFEVEAWAVVEVDWQEEVVEGEVVEVKYVLRHYVVDLL